MEDEQEVELDLEKQRHSRSSSSQEEQHAKTDLEQQLVEATTTIAVLAEQLKAANEKQQNLEAELVEARASTPQLMTELAVAQERLKVAEENHVRLEKQLADSQSRVIVDIPRLETELAVAKEQLKAFDDKFKAMKLEHTLELENITLQLTSMEEKHELQQRAENLLTKSKGRDPEDLPTPERLYLAPMMIMPDMSNALTCVTFVTGSSREAIDEKVQRLRGQLVPGAKAILVESQEEADYIKQAIVERGRELTQRKRNKNPKLVVDVEFYNEPNKLCTRHADDEATTRDEFLRLFQLPFAPLGELVEHVAPEIEAPEKTVDNEMPSVATTSPLKKIVEKETPPASPTSGEEMAEEPRPSRIPSVRSWRLPVRGPNLRLSHRFGFSCDPAMLLAILAGLSEAGQPELWDEDSDEDEQTQSLSTQEGMVQRFKMMRARFVRPGGIFGEQILAGNLRTGRLSLDDAKSASDARSLRDLTPMTGKELELGTTHRGRYLCGWVAVDDAFFGIASSSLILEDVTGYLVEIAAYGLVDTELPAHERQRVVAGKLSKGRPIVVLEPYYKVRMDGSVGVRVDEAEEIIPWQDVPTDLMSWKKLGNEFFSTLDSQNDGRGALACYKRALEVAQSEVELLAVLLTNIATCRSKVEDYAAIIQLSGAAVHLDPTYFKDGWRKEGSVCFFKGDFECAEEKYRKGVEVMRSCCQNASVVLNNVAAVYLRLHQASSASSEEVPNIEAAVLNSSVAGIVDPLNHKAWLRRVRCLGTMGFSHEKCVQDLQGIRANVVLSAVEHSGQLKVFEQNLDVVILNLTRSETAKRDIKSTETPSEQRDEKPPPDVPKVEEYEEIDQYIARLEGFVERLRMAHAISKSQSNPRLQLLPLEMQMFFANPPPEIHTEFPKLRKWPEGIDAALAQKLLYRAFLDASVNPWIDALRMRDGSFFDTISFGDRVKRWHGTGAMELLRARGSVHHGDIVDAREALSDYAPRYDAKTRSNFSNNVSRADIYYFDSTHVAIGFTDCSSLLAATLCENSSRDGPLRYVGFEMSEFAVAKWKVAALMLGSSSVSISSVMEVWLSSTWSETTLKDFRNSLNVVLTSLQEQDENPKVMAYLKHWASAETISAAEARSQFFSNLVKHSSRILPALCCFCRQIDRLDLTQYMLTGEIRASPDVVNLVEKEQPGATKRTNGSTGQAKKKRNRKKKRTAKGKRVKASDAASLVGNLTMWNVPANSPPLDDEIALNTVDFRTLVEDYVDPEKKQKNSTKRLSVLDLFVIYILKNLHRLRGLMLANILTVEVNYGVVKAGRDASDPVDEALLTRIAELQPETISWSNLLDYFSLEGFHDLARRCSMYGNCLHYGHSTNWSAQVFGASMIDYHPGNASVMIEAVLNSALGLSNEALPGPPLLSMVNMLTKENLDKLLFLPFPASGDFVHTNELWISDGYKQCGSGESSRSLAMRALLELVLRSKCAIGRGRPF
ncbi:uncharacterized protein PITG_18172 [Phytophthora infestans T30-4]|uniref:Uncharacterized protein n=1 Tax=Phytophthora infestans (strain T30-4) TaxID=403677 RepID=D0NX68_PHYIT|nr:uncharacterized protein PITG_18172 [Phytophthora infestans T30-4]EEY67663.1 conserved hypothetical protein [Phytophthora infestans T30-4]|eukprot:XP_002896326.1 conserved hypothetical protein [Phytophthora infestans T30-4]